jgi:hypothetical protein
MSNLLEMLQSQDPNFTSLEMSCFARDFAQIEPEEVASLEAAFKDNKFLKSLIFDNYPMRLEAFRVLLKVLNSTAVEMIEFRGDESTTVVKFGFFGNDRYEAIGVLAKELQENKTLKHIVFKDFPIGPEESKSIAELIRNNETLKALEFSSCGIRPAGAKLLAEALKENKALRIFAIAFNEELECRGVDYIAEALRTNQALRILSLCHCNIGVYGMRAILRNTRNNTTLESVALFGEEEGMETFEEIIQRKRYNLNHTGKLIFENYLWVHQKNYLLLKIK